MANNKIRILAVIDPTRSEQWGLWKALSIAKSRDDVVVYAFLCAHSEAERDNLAELRSVELRRHTIWLDELLAGIDDDGINIERVVHWNDDWREAICLFAKKADVNLVVKRASGRQKSLASSDRYLLRTLQSALLLVKHDPAKEIQKVLVAVDFNATDESHSELNSAIMKLGNRLRGSIGNMELHAVSAYAESGKFIHPPDVAKALGISRSQAHVRQGSACDVIPVFANEIEADLVIVGNVARRGLSGLIVGNTAEKILTNIEADVLVLVREEAA